MSQLNSEIISAFKSFDSATIFNAMVKISGLPCEAYTDHTLRCLLPELGPVVGYAATVEISTNDPDSQGLDWIDYYKYLDQFPY